MATADEILATMAEEAAETGQAAEVCTIDRCTRAVTIPEALRIVGVETDKDVTRRQFRVLCSYRGTNLSTFRIRIHFMNANKEKDIYYVTDAAQDGEYLTFSWVISRKATKYKGKLQFIACMVCDGGTDEEREWNSTLGEFAVLEGLEVELTEGEEEQARDAITQLLNIIDERVDGAVKGWLDMHPEATTTVQDKSLDIAKFTDDTKLNVVKDYVTPQMFGAIGDGTNDDSEAIQSAMDYAYDHRQYRVHIPAGIYYLSKPLYTQVSIDTDTGAGIHISGENGTVLTRKHADITPPFHPADDPLMACLVVSSNDNVIENLEFRKSKVGLYLGQSPKDGTGLCRVNFNRIRNVFANACGVGIDLVAGYGVYYNTFENFRVSYGNVGIDIGRNYENVSNSSCANRNNFVNGEINKTFCGVRLGFRNDSNVFHGVHFEQVSTKNGSGTAPDWLPDGKGVAIYGGGLNNVFTSCICEANDCDLYDAGYNNQYSHNAIDLAKTSIADSQHLGMSLFNSMTSNDYFVKLGGYISQTENLLPGVGVWNNTFTRPVVLKDVMHDYGYAMLKRTLADVMVDASVVVGEWLGTYPDTQNNVFCHCRIGRINHVYIKGAFKVTAANTNSLLKFNLPAGVHADIGAYADRQPMRVMGLAGNAMTCGVLIGQQLQVYPPDGGWSTDAFVWLDFNFEYPS